MQRNRRQQFNTINAPALVRGVLLTAFIAVTGLIYVYLTIQSYRLGDRKKALETELAGLRTQSDLATGQITALTSSTALQRRVKEGYLRMIPIAEHAIVRLNEGPSAPAEDAIQPVANLRR